MKRFVTIDRLDLDLRGTDRAIAEQAVALLGPTLARQFGDRVYPSAPAYSPAQALADRIAAGLTPHLSVQQNAQAAPKGE